MTNIGIITAGDVLPRKDIIKVIAVGPQRFCAEAHNIDSFSIEIEKKYQSLLRNNTIQKAIKEEHNHHEYPKKPLIPYSISCDIVIDDAKDSLPIAHRMPTKRLIIRKNPNILSIRCSVCSLDISMLLST